MEENDPTKSLKHSKLLSSIFWLRHWCYPYNSTVYIFLFHTNEKRIHNHITKFQTDCNLFISDFSIPISIFFGMYYLKLIIVIILYIVQVEIEKNYSFSYIMLILEVEACLKASIFSKTLKSPSFVLNTLIILTSSSCGAL